MEKKCAHIIVILLLILVANVLISCEYEYTYCFTINNSTDDSMLVKTTPIISNYKLQIHNVYYQSPEIQGFSYYHDHPTNTDFTIPPRASLSALTSWYSRKSMNSIPERDGIVPLWSIIEILSVNRIQIDPENWKKESKWKKKILNDGATIIYTLDITSHEDTLIFRDCDYF